MKKFCLISLFLLLFPAQAQAAAVQHNFTIFLGPFNAGKTRFTYTLHPREYSVRSKVETAGIFNTLYPFTAEYATTGKIKGKDLETSSYKYKSQSRFNTRRKELIYDPNGNPVYRISAKNDKVKKVEIESSPDNKDTTDLQTVIAELALQYNKNKNCNARMQIFDGKRRFDTIFKDEGKEEITANEYSSFGGTAHKCSMYIDKLLNDGDDLLWELTSEKPIYFWILEDKESRLPFIARIEIEDTPLGKLQVFTQTIQTEK
ncbi:MAG: DUF3108 domain-containing protein [Alphaproteobacteria bacterium]|nr:DUF3108 domain-containing protein [Alphaproteobacteria bacterium]